jgi:anthranilate synthase component 2
MILIIDNYDSFTYNLVHLVADYTPDYTVVRNDKISIDDIRAMAPHKILISPGPGRPEDAGITPDIIRHLGAEIPILGVCLGHQAIGMVYGGDVVYAPSLMHGKTSLIEHDGKTIFQDVPASFIATRYHSLVLDPNTLPDSLEVTSRTPDGVVMGVRHRTHPVEGIQFHPESILTVEGPKLLANWLKS